MPRGKPPQSKKQWYIAVGVGRVDPSTGLSELPFASSDCQQIAQLFEETKLSSQDRVIALHDVASEGLLPTKYNVTQVLEEVKEKGSGDTVVVYLTCHGVRDKEGKLYFCLSDTRGSSTQGIDLTTALSARELVTTLVESKAANIILLIDSCHSGAVDFPDSQDLPSKETLSEDTTFYGIFSCTSRQQSFSHHQIGGALMSCCLQKALRGEFNIHHKTNNWNCDELFNCLNDAMNRFHTVLQRQSELQAYSNGENRADLPPQEPTRKVVHKSKSPEIAKALATPIVELQPRKGLIVNAANSEIESGLLTRLKDYGSFNEIESWDGKKDLLSAIKTKLKSIRGTVLLYFRGKLSNDNILEINNYFRLPAASLYQLLQQHQSVKQILLFDLEAADSTMVRAWIESLKIKSQLGQCIVVSSNTQQSSNLAQDLTELLKEDKNKVGLDAAEFITQLQDRKREFYLYGERDIIEIIVSHQQRNIYTDVGFWKDYIDKYLPQEISSNFLTADVNSETTFKIQEFYVPLGLVERKERPKKKEIESSQEGSSLYDAEAVEITQKFTGQEFFERILLNREGKSKGRRIAITGEPGGGKTTCSQNISNLLSAHTQIPIWISLARLGDNSLIEYLEKIWLPNIARYSGLAIEQLKSALINQFQLGNVWLILDGIDEIASDNKLGQVESYLKEGYISEARIIVTCRLNTWETPHELLASFDTYRTLPFEDEQIDNFIGNFVGVKADRDNLLEQLENNQRIKDLVRNPLRLMLLCIAWLKGEKSLPDTQAQLYALFVEQFYKFKQDKFSIFKKRHGLKLKERINQTLGEISKEALDRDHPTFLIDFDSLSDELQDRLDEQIEEKTIYDWICDLGWLNNVGVSADNPGETVYAFFHATFQEYFAATAIDDWDYFLPREHTNFPVPNKKYRIFESQWKQVILFWIGQEKIDVEVKEAFIRKLFYFDDGLPFEKNNHYNYNYSWQAVVLVISCSFEFESELVVHQIYSNLIYVNLKNTKILSFFKTRIVVNVLAKLIQNTSIEESIRCEAIKRLAVIGVGNKTAVDILVRLAENASIEESIRYEAIDRLAVIGVGNKTTVDTLVRLVENASIEESIRYKVIQTLVKIDPRNKTAINALVALLQNISVHWWTHLSVLEWLGKIEVGNKTAINALVALLQNISVNNRIRLQAIQSLTVIGVGNDIATDALIHVVENSSFDESIRCEAIRSLAVRGENDNTATDALVRILENASLDKPIRYEAIETLVEIDPESEIAIYILFSIVQDISVDKSIRIRLLNLFANTKVKNKIAINALISIFHDGHVDSTIRYEAIKTLVEIDPENEIAINSIVNVFKNDHDRETTFKAAIYLLTKTGIEKSIAINALIDILHISSFSESIHCEAIRGLAKIGRGNKTVSNVLVNILQISSFSESIHCEAIQTLIKIDPENKIAINTLIGIINNAYDSWIFATAIDSLAEIGVGDKTAINAIVGILQNTYVNKWYYTLAINSLAKIGVGNETAINALAGLLQDSSVCKEAFISIVITSLAKIGVGNETAINALVGVSQDSSVDKWDRQEAIRSLPKIGGIGNVIVIDALINLIQNAFIDKVVVETATYTLDETNKFNYNKFYYFYYRKGKIRWKFKALLKAIGQSFKN